MRGYGQLCHRRALIARVNNHIYFCLIVKVFPATLIRALRPDGPVFGATE
jgi:hypothetical protein